MLNSMTDRRRSVPHEVENPERIPVDRYYDADFYQAELDHLWPHVWQMACRLEQIPEIGDWIEYSNVGESVVIVRTAGGIKAWHNACRHRGVPFVGGGSIDCSHNSSHGNCAKSGFVCPFHGWRWDMDGNNKLVYARHLFDEAQLDDGINLKPCRVEVWGGCAWINFDDDAPALKECLGPIADRLDAHHFGQLRAEWSYATVLPANWKTAMEAFMEGYHVAQTHPQLHHAMRGLYYDMYDGIKDGAGSTAENMRKGAMPGTTTRQAIDAQFSHLELLSDGMSGMVHAKEIEIARQLLDMDLPEDPNQAVPLWFGKLFEEITEQLKAKGEPIPDLTQVSKSDPVRPVEFLFPHFFLLPMFSSMASYRVRPLGPEHCFFELWSLTFFPQGEEPEPVMEPIVLPYDSPQFPLIPRQDYSNIPIQQKGLHSRSFEYMRLAKDIEGMVSNYQRLIDGYLAGVAPEALARAQHHLGGNFDGKVLDLGL